MLCNLLCNVCLIPLHFRARAHCVFFGLTQLRFSKFLSQMANTRRQTQSRQRRGGACVDVVASAFFLRFCGLMTSTTVRWLIFQGKRSMLNRSRGRKTSIGDKVLSFSTEVVLYAFTDVAVDSWHPLSPVQPTIIEVACRTWTYVIFDTMLLDVLLSLSAYSSRICFSISLVRLTMKTQIFFFQSLEWFRVRPKIQK